MEKEIGKRIGERNAIIVIATIIILMVAVGGYITHVQPVLEDIMYK